MDAYDFAFVRVRKKTLSRVRYLHDAVQSFPVAFNYDRKCRGRPSSDPSRCELPRPYAVLGYPIAGNAKIAHTVLDGTEIWLCDSTYWTELGNGANTPPRIATWCGGVGEG